MPDKDKGSDTGKDDMLVMVGEGAEDENEEQEETPEKKPKPKGGEGKDSDDSGEVDDDAGEDDDEEQEAGGEEGDERVGHGETEEDGSPKRRSRQERKRRQREAKERDKTELRFLRTRNEQLEKRFSAMDHRMAQNETVAVDSRIGQLKAQVKVADEVMARATKAGDGEALVEAQNIKEELNQSIRRLEGHKGNIAEQAKAAQTPQLSAEVLANAQHFMRRNPWYDPQKRDRDSKRLAVLDEEVLSEGFDPESPEYWTELEDRAREFLPHRFKGKKKNGVAHEENEDEDEDESEPARRKSSGPRVSVGGRERTLRKNEVYISPDRKAAMIESGAWDDPVLKARQLKQYQKWDREHSGKNN